MVSSRADNENNKRKCIKCVIWDLDNTLWDGVLVEDYNVSLRGNVTELIKTLDGRGILHSIASRNDHDQAMLKLQEFGLREYFLYPQINWNSNKSSSIEAIAESINVDLDAIAFIDDQAFERDEVAFRLTEVLCIDAALMDQLLTLPEMIPPSVTEDSRGRRLTYINEQKRKQAEDAFFGTPEEFLATLDMSLTISPASEDDLERMKELTLRTNQLNTTGYTYSLDELDYFRRSANHKLMLASLEDKYGAYGKIGLAVLECGGEEWMIKLLLTSCRVISRGVGTILLNHIMGLAKAAAVRLRAEFVTNRRNRLMLVTYKFAGFYEVERVGSRTVLQNDLTRIQPFPRYMRIELGD